jgi:hypothetical protein
MGPPRPRRGGSGGGGGSPGASRVGAWRARPPLLAALALLLLLACVPLSGAQVGGARPRASGSVHACSGGARSSRMARAQRAVPHARAAGARGAAAAPQRRATRAPPRLAPPAPTPLCSPPRQDACLLGPWQAGGARPAYTTRTVTVGTFAELQRHVDAASGPTVLLVRATGPLNAGGMLVVAKPDIVITTAAAWDASGAGYSGQRIAVACGGAKTLVSIK